MTGFKLQTLKKEIDHLSLAEKIELLAYITEKTQELSSFSAENKAIERFVDLDEPNQWATTIDQKKELDEAALNHWLQERGYQTEISNLKFIN
jgi:predicted ATPase